MLTMLRTHSFEFGHELFGTEKCNFKNKRFRKPCTPSLDSLEFIPPLVGGFVKYDIKFYSLPSGNRCFEENKSLGMLFSLSIRFFKYVYAFFFSPCVGLPSSGINYGFSWIAMKNFVFQNSLCFHCFREGLLPLYE